MPSKTYRTIFFGTSDFAVPALSALAASPDVRIVAVITQPDEPVGREQALTPPPVKVAAERLRLPLLQPRTLRDFSPPDADVGVVAAYGKMIPKTVLDAPRHGMLNIHPSLLPKYRGPSPIQAAIANGDSKTGVTIMKVDAQMDHGPILAQKTHRLRGDETAPELTTTLAALGAELLVTTIVPYVEGRLAPQEQDHARATTTKLLTRDDGRVDWSLAASDILRRFRAYTPWPGLWTVWNRKGRPLRIKLLKLRFLPLQGGGLRWGCGSVVVDDSRLLVTCANNTALEILRLQPEGKAPQNTADFLRGHADISNTVLDAPPLEKGDTGGSSSAIT